MLIRNVCLILICSVSFVAAAAQQSQTPKKPKPKLIKVEDVEKTSPADKKKHKDHPDKEKLLADIGVNAKESVEWCYKEDFFVSNVEQENPTKKDDQNPFHTPIDQMKSFKKGQRYCIDSGDLRTDIVFQEVAKGEMPRNYYKFSFTLKESGKVIDPHLGVHP